MPESEWTKVRPRNLANASFVLSQRAIQQKLLLKEMANGNFYESSYRRY
jgi:hypothetical protein